MLVFFCYNMRSIFLSKEISMTTETVTQPVNSLADTVSALVKSYVKSMGRDKVVNLRDLLLDQVEPAILEVVMLHCRYNQSRAAKMLGISRGTCRALLIKYFDDQYCGRREEKADK